MNNYTTDDLWFAAFCTLHGAYLDNVNKSKNNRFILHLKGKVDFIDLHDSFINGDEVSAIEYKTAVVNVKRKMFRDGE